MLSGEQICFFSTLIRTSSVDQRADPVLSFVLEVAALSDRSPLPWNLLPSALPVLASAWSRYVSHHSLSSSLSAACFVLATRLLGLRVGVDHPETHRSHSPFRQDSQGSATPSQGSATPPPSQLCLHDSPMSKRRKISFWPLTIAS